MKAGSALTSRQLDCKAVEWQKGLGSMTRVEGEPTVRAKIAVLAAALALAGPAQAQFGPVPFPLIVVPPPPAQNYVIPKPRSIQPPRPVAQPPDSQTPHELQCHYQGQTRVCE